MNIDSTIVLDHGSGGYLSKKFLDDVIIPSIKPVYEGIMEDSGIVNLASSRIAFTTDSYVINPIFFGNGNIGKIAVCGTVNDLAVSGAKPLYISLAFILEEGFPVDQLRTILNSICNTCIESDVKILAGDTKVVRKGEADKIYINTTGIGVFQVEANPLHLTNIKEGDDIIISGYVGNHGIHILSMREGLGFEHRVPSDCAPLNKPIEAILLKYGKSIHYMRDLTRGGVGSIFNEIALDINKSFLIKEKNIPLQHETFMASEMLGISPLYLANEGNICILCDPLITPELIKDLQKFEYTKNAMVCGKVVRDKTPRIVLQREDGQISLLDFLKGAELPRLC